MGRENRFQEADDNPRLLREGSVLGLQLYKSVVQKGHKLEKRSGPLFPISPLLWQRWVPIRGASLGERAAGVRLSWSGA